MVSHLLRLWHRHAEMPFSCSQGPAGLDGLDGKDGKPGLRVRQWAGGGGGNPLPSPSFPKSQSQGILMKGAEPPHLHQGYPCLPPVCLSHPISPMAPDPLGLLVLLVA